MAVKGIGTVEYKIVTDKGTTETLIIKGAYYVPQLNIRFLSPQQICKQSTRRCMYEGDDTMFRLRWNGHAKTIPFSKANNLAILHSAPGSSFAKHLVAQLSSIPQQNLSCYRCAKTVPRYNLQPSLESCSSDDEATSPELADTHQSNTKDITLKCSVKHCADCSRVAVTSQEEFNIQEISSLSEAQKELLHIHECMGHPNFTIIQDLARRGLLPRRLANVTPPQCLSCHLGKAHKLARSTHNKIVSDSVKRPGDLVHLDQAETSTPGRPMTYSGRNSPDKITCFTLFVDSISKKIFVHFQHSTSTAETLVGKQRFERLAYQYNVTVRNYRADNGVFRSRDFKADIEKNKQHITYCGVGAHHQNGVAERHIRSIVEKARTSLLHASTKWLSAEVDTELWTYAVNLAVFQWNHTPRRDLHYLCPEEAFTGIKQSSFTTSFNKRLFHPFGCPVLVLETALQNGQSLPKFDPRCRMGVYLGHSSEHASNVALVLNPKTGIISNQFHLVFDDKFETISSADSSKTGQLALWTDISKRINAVESDPTISFTPEVFNPSPSTNIYNLNDMSTPESADHDEEERRLANGTSPPSQEPPAAPSADKNNNNPPDSGKGKPSHSPVSQNPSSSRRRTPYILDPQCKSNYDSHTTNPKRRSNRKRKRSQKVQDAISHIHAMAAAFASSSRHLPFSERIEQLLNLSSLNSGEINDIDPLAFAASANPNILSHREAMTADDVEKFLESMQEELERMDDNEIYEEVLRSSVPKAQKILRAVWSHRRKTTPIGLVYRHRSRLCVDGSRQQHGIDYHDTYSPVVSWTTVRLLLILSKLLNLSSRKVDYVQAFPQAPLEDEDVYMELPAGYTVKSANKNVVLKLKKNLYGLKQAAYNWHELLKSGLLKLGFKQSQVEPCLFMKQDIVCLLYVDDTLFFATDDKIIDKHISALQSLQFELTDEGDVDTFLGVKLTNNPDGSITMTQPAMTEQVLKALGLTNDSKSHKTPATSPPLHAHQDGAERTENWNYKSVIGMLIYLAKNTRPDIEYAVHQCARFQLNPKKAHENAVKRIGRYLLGTRDKGITFTPKLEEINSVECFVDADFAGNYTKETSHDPDSVKSRTGCIIRFAGCPITWFSRLQTEIALSTTEAEYIALSTAARTLLPLRELMIEISALFNLKRITPDVKCTLFEDNIGAEMLAKAQKMNPRTKHIAVKYHHFREAVSQGYLNITRVATDRQLADILTKPVPLTTLEPLRKEIMGWLSMFRESAQQCSFQEYEILCNCASILPLQ